MKKPRNKSRAKSQTTMTISIPDELKQRIKDAADAERRSSSNWAVKLLTEYLDQRAAAAAGKNSP